MSAQNQTERELTRADILPAAEYAATRRERRRAITSEEAAAHRSGSLRQFFFENYATMWQQVHEMLHVEKGGEAQVADELEAYNPMIPQGSELVATVMLEIDDRRGGPMCWRGSAASRTTPSSKSRASAFRQRRPDRENTSPDGKASSVQFLWFRFTREQIARFKAPGARVIVGFDHPNYAHMAVIPESVRTSLAEDFD